MSQPYNGRCPVCRGPLFLASGPMGSHVYCEEGCYRVAQQVFEDLWLRFRSDGDYHAEQLLADLLEANEEKSHESDIASA